MRMLHTDIAIIDDVLDAHAHTIGRDLEGYRNHVYRVANFCLFQLPEDGGHLEQVAAAAVFHDIGIWTDRTFDYLPPSIAAASAWLARTGRSAWSPKIARMIGQHHKLRYDRTDSSGLVEAFREADLVDLSHGLASFGISRPFRREVFKRWPDAGFHLALARLALGRLCTHPWNPLPMVRL
jgi:hypothetical protein